MRIKKILFAILNLFLVGTYSIIAQPNVQVISDAPGNQWQSDIDGNYIVWLDERDGIPQVYLYNILDSTTQQITTSANQKLKPYISGAIVIWSEKINGQLDIYIFDIANPQFGIYPLIDFQEDQFILAFKEGKLLFRDFSCGPFGCLVYYDLNTSPPTILNVTNPNDGPVSEADIDDYLVVYCLWDDIYLYNTFTFTTIQITNDDIKQSHPSISIPRVCWAASEYGGDSDIYLFDYSLYSFFGEIFCFNISKRFIEPAREASNQYFPYIEENKIVFSDDITGKCGIYLYSIPGSSVVGTTTEIFTSYYHNLNPVIRDQKICWYDDKNDPWLIPPTNADVYMWAKPTGADLSVASYFASKFIQLHEIFTITLLISNSGPLAATNVRFVDSLSSKLEIISASSNEGTITWNSNNVINWAINSLTADSKIEVAITCKAIATGKARNLGFLASDQPDYILSNNSIDQAFQIKDTRTYSNGLENSGTNTKIRVDKNGFIHILTYNDFPVLITYITNKTGFWQQKMIDNSQGDLFVTGADLDVDDQGNGHIVYVISPYGPNYPYKTLYYTTNTSGQWKSTLPIGPMGGQMFSPIIRLDSNGKVHIAFKTSRFSGQVFYLNNVYENWSLPELISDSYNSFSMDIDNNNFIHFAIYDINSGPVYITNRPEGQRQTPEIVDQNWTGGQKETLVLDIAVDSSNTPHISYVGDFINDEDYKYAVKVNDAWQNFFVDTCAFMGGFNAIAVDKSGIPYIMYVTPNSQELRYAKKDGTFFSQQLIESGMDNYLSNFFDIDCDPFNNIQFVYYKNGLCCGTNSPYKINFGGGDENSGGYFFANSLSDGSPSHPVYNWIDPLIFSHNIVTNWTEGDADNGYLGPVNLPFNFPFFSRLYNEVFINSNGYLSFSNGYTLTASNATIPFIYEPNNILAACAMDLILDTNLYSDTKVYFGTSEDKFVVTYFHAHPKLSANDYITFQIILYPNGNILYQYNDTESTTPLSDEIAEDALIGIENLYGTQGICYRNNGAGGPIFSSPLAVMFGTNSLVLPVEYEQNNIPDKFVLFQNYPNPFNPSTTISWQSPVGSWQTIKVFDVLGREIETIVDGYYEAGSHSTFYIVNSKLSSGVYFYQLKVADPEIKSGQSFIQTKKMILIK